MVVFPRTRMTLAVAREKSVLAVEEAMTQPEHLLVAASQRDPEIDDPQPKDIYPTGTLVEVSNLHRQPDGSIQMLLSGVSRVQIEEYDELQPYLRVHITTPMEILTRDPQADALV